MYLRQSWGYKKHAFKKARETEGRQSDVESENRRVEGRPGREKNLQKRRVDAWQTTLMIIRFQ